MADELDLDLDEIDQNQERASKVEKRIKDLSEKVKLTSEERDEQKRLLGERDVQLADTSKERDFFKNFNPLTTKYPGSADYQDKILEKVKAGYEVEDATISILAKEGKFQGTPTPPPPRENPAGGSAVNTITGETDKPLNEMSRDEKRAKLLDAEVKGDISLT